MSRCDITFAQCSSHQFRGRESMRIALASHDRLWMLALFPATFGFGSAALRLHCCNWPLSLDEAGISLRRQHRVGWNRDVAQLSRRPHLRDSDLLLWRSEQNSRARPSKWPKRCQGRPRHVREVGGTAVRLRSRAFEFNRRITTPQN